MEIFSIGYEKRRIVEFCASLKEAGVEALVDVRERAWSNRPEYRKQALKRALATVGIDYIHLKEAGNPYRPRKGEVLDVEKCRRAYSEHLRQNRGILEKAWELAQARPSAFFCYESITSHCHRGVLLTRLRRPHGARLVHL